ncbi:twin-arginine translocase TatA/TatE family subunit [Flaviflexus equikiangi]|uniref:Sec-independent protein translocase protein TatA n=1 Tax=Flaviflexus equikiangi TaxID=2758573 RepID=A0ABS2THM9_9ACTO|nr:twin-arginine translocase TatA/TatE family subunit [Flaviflexus equikiangi]MBM9434165.1 twin-arginine translocase TatA/TatE family subunit [Flaviflexus equikiangi]
MNLSGWEILIILLVLILVFGAAKLPMIASSVGKSMKVFKKEVTELREDTNPNTPPAPTAQPDAPRASYDATAPRDEREGQDPRQ